MAGETYGMAEIGPAVPTYLRYWGKASKTDLDAYHLLSYHCLDVAAVADAWLNADNALRATFARASRADPDLVHAWTLFFVALHDLGKFDVRFQLKAPALAYRLNPLCKEADANEAKGFRHWDSGYAWSLKEWQDYGFTAPPTEGAAEWLSVVCSHHSRGLCDTITPPRADVNVVKHDRLARQEFVKLAVDAFLRPVGLSPVDSPPACPNLLAGFCSVCDWIASNSEETYFPFSAGHDNADPIAYLNARGVHARGVLTRSGLFTTSLTQGGMTVLFRDKTPRGVQTLVDQWPAKPGLTLIEAPTGSGKTEAALAHASRLLAAGLADGIVFALPTQASANAMLGRLDKVVNLVFPAGGSIVLAHGKRRFNPMYKAMVAAATRGLPGDREDGVSQCAAWLAESRKRVFLGQIGVCTIDQTLLSVLPVRHYFVRGFGLRRNVLVVDEIHAYDRYMNTLLDRVLREQRDAGGSVVLLSATLPSNRRNEILSQWAGAEAAVEGKGAYPLVSFACTNAEASPRPMTVSTQTRTVGVKCVETPDMHPPDDLLREVRRRAEAGACVAVICNLVDVAQILRRSLEGTVSVPVDLFHARFRFVDRQEIETAVIQEHYGEKRPNLSGRILIATQVVEQSLDLDFDWLVTQLCPVDLLFQRLGRMHRHARIRPPCAASASCVVVVPESANYGKHLAIYADPLVLWRTEQFLRRGDSIVFPDAYRDWIEDVYCRPPGDEDPALIRQAHDDCYVKALVSRSCALQLAVPDSLSQPWADTDDRAAEPTRDGEMSLNVVPVLNRGGKKFFLDVESALDTFDECTLAEQLNLQNVPVPASWRNSLPLPEDGVYYLPMELSAGGSWKGQCGKVVFWYSRTYGLWKE